MTRPDLLTELARRPLLCDGGMGTQLMAAGLAAGACGEGWNLEHPDRVEDIHVQYRRAGCDLITTNTFGGTAAALERHGLAGRCDEINRAAVAIARRAAGDAAYVTGNIGPFGGFLEPLGETTADELLGIFETQARALREAGADAALIETMTDPSELELAVRAARSAGDWPVIATFAFDRAGGDTYRTMMGADVGGAIGRAIDAGADVIGANCGASMELADYVHLAREIAAVAGDRPVIIQPNAGSPRMIDGRTCYPARPDDMADVAGQLLDSGARIVGGCCGTTPNHLRAMADVLARRIT